MSAGRQFLVLWRKRKDAPFSVAKAFIPAVAESQDEFFFLDAWFIYINVKRKK